MSDITGGTDSRRFEPGELVNVTIRNARYDGPGLVGAHSIAVGSDVYDVPYTAVVERVAPKEWPPQTGDIWADRNQNEWLGERIVPAGIDVETRHTLLLISSQDVCGYRDEADAVASDVGPMRLVRRRGWTPVEPSTVDEPERVDARTATAAGLQAFAELVATRTDIEVPYSIDGQVGFVGEEGLAEAQRIAASLGAELAALRDSGVPYQGWTRSGRIQFGGGVALTLYVHGLNEPVNPDPDNPTDGTVAQDEPSEAVA